MRVFIGIKKKSFSRNLVGESASKSEDFKSVRDPKKNKKTLMEFCTLCKDVSTREAIKMYNSYNIGDLIVGCEFDHDPFVNSYITADPDDDESEFQEQLVNGILKFFAKNDMPAATVRALRPHVDATFSDHGM